MDHSGIWGLSSAISSSVTRGASRRQAVQRSEVSSLIWLDSAGRVLLGRSPAWISHSQRFGAVRGSPAPRSISADAKDIGSPLSDSSDVSNLSDEETPCAHTIAYLRRELLAWY